MPGIGDLVQDGSWVYRIMDRGSIVTRQWQSNSMMAVGKIVEDYEEYADRMEAEGECEDYGTVTCEVTVHQTPAMLARAKREREMLRRAGRRASIMAKHSISPAKPPESPAKPPELPA